ncbi:MAG: hypothetical protein AB8B57_00790 [Congregibacter sp.]
MITAERARGLLDAYGGKASNWPDEYRLQLQEFVDGSHAAQQWCREARELDDLLDSSELLLPDLTEQIMQAIPISVSERLLAWLFPHSIGECWRPAMAAAFPLIVGVAIGISDPLASESDVLELAGWEATEVALLESRSSDIWYE